MPGSKGRRGSGKGRGFDFFKLFDVAMFDQSLVDRNREDSDAGLKPVVVRAFDSQQLPAAAAKPSGQIGIANRAGHPRSI